MKRTSRTGPLAVMNQGNRFCELAKAICGLDAGLLPPMAGWTWQAVQELALKRGPKPSATPSTSWKLADAVLNIAVRAGERPATGPPAPAGPPPRPWIGLCPAR